MCRGLHGAPARTLMSVRFFAAMSAAALLSVTGSAMGQVGAGSAAPADAVRTQSPAASAASSPAASARLGYRSAFDGYRSFNDQPVVSWREANDLVGRIGGWQAYAREGQGGAAGGMGEMPASHDMSNMPAAPVTPDKPAQTPSAAGSPRPSPAPVKATPSPNAPAASGAGAHSGHKTP